MQTQAFKKVKDTCPPKCKASTLLFFYSYLNILQTQTSKERESVLSRFLSSEVAAPPPPPDDVHTHSVLYSCVTAHTHAQLEHQILFLKLQLESRILKEIQNFYY